MAEPVDDVRNFNPFWHTMLSGEHPMLRRGRKMFRLLSPTAAKGGEMIMSEAIWQDVSCEIAAEPRNLELKGYLRHARYAGMTGTATHVRASI